MGRDIVEVVRGKQVLQMDGSALEREATRYGHVVIDVGTGDGRWIYRLARVHPHWLCLGVDANAERMRESSFRAGRKLSRGGARNAWFIHAAVEALPPALHGLADQIHIYFPWGRLLEAVITPDPVLLANIAQLERSGATLTVRVNVMIVSDGQLGVRAARSLLRDQDLSARLGPGYARAGIRLIHAGLQHDSTHTSWNRRLNRGNSGYVIALYGTIAGPTAP